MNLQSSIVVGCVIAGMVLIIAQLAEMVSFLSEELAMADAENEYLFLYLLKETSHG